MPHIDKEDRKLLKALRQKGRSKPIDAHEHGNGKVPPANRGGVATATAAKLRKLMESGLVNASYWDGAKDSPVLYDVTSAGQSEALLPEDHVNEPEDPKTPPGKDKEPGKPKNPKAGGKTP